MAENHVEWDPFDYQGQTECRQHTRRDRDICTGPCAQAHAGKAVLLASLRMPLLQPKVSQDVQTMFSEPDGCPSLAPPNNAIFSREF